MSVDWFLADAPHVVPREFQAWQVARACHARLVLRLAEDTTSGIDPEALGEHLHLLALAELAARHEAGRLKRIARLAWRRAR